MSAIELLGVGVWLVVIGCVVFVLILSWRFERKPNLTPYRCRTCGYDLRATPDRCPECGTAIAAEREGDAPTEPKRTG